MTSLKYEFPYLSLLLFSSALIIVVAESLIVQKKAPRTFGWCWICGWSSTHSAKPKVQRQSAQGAGGLPSHALALPTFHCHRAHSLLCVRGVHWLFSLHLSYRFLHLSISKRSWPSFPISPLVSQSNFWAHFQTPLLLQTEQPVPSTPCQRKL